MAQPFTNSGGVVSICTTPQNNDLGDHVSDGFPSLTYVPIANIGAVGEYGASDNMVSYDTWDRNNVLKAKGMRDAGSPTLEVARDRDNPGQLALYAAAQTRDNYAFRIAYSDGSTDYIRGPVGGPTHPGGRNEDFVLDVYTIGANEVVEIPAP